METPPDLDAAFGLRSPDEAARVYRAWAGRYDSDFIAARDYRLAEVVALAFAGRGGRGPVLDLGAGTGALGEHLARIGIGPLEALDLSPEMLEVAAAKGCYDALLAGDAHRPLDLETAYYNGVVSAGAFAECHLGPAVLDEVLRVTAHGGLVCIAVDRRHFHSAGFEARLEALGASVQDLRIDEAKVYGPGAEDPWRGQLARIVSFHRA